MKKTYKTLLVVIASMIAIGVLMGIFSIMPNTVLWGFIGKLLFFTPIQILMYLLSKDESVTNKKRIVSTVVFWYVNYCLLWEIIDLVLTLF